MNTYLLKLWFQVTTLWRLKELFKVSNMIFHASNKKNRLLGTHFLSTDLTGAIASCGNADNDSVMVHALWCPPSALLAVPKFMNNVFPEQWMAQSKPIARPDSCADLNSLQFYLWGHPKSTVCATEVSNARDLQHWIQNGVEMIRTTHGIFQRVRQ